MALETRESIRERIANTLSTNGMAAGQIGSLIIILISLGVIKLMNMPDSTYPMQICIALVGTWWLTVSCYTWVTLKVRAGPPLPAGTRNYIWFSWCKTVSAIKYWRKLPNTFLYLLCYLAFSDAFTTIASIAVLFA